MGPLGVEFLGDGHPPAVLSLGTSVAPAVVVGLWATRLAGESLAFGFARVAFAGLPSAPPGQPVLSIALGK
jgi:hypothetical protein